MYHFGSPQDAAKLALNEISSYAGPGLVTEGNLDTWTQEEIRQNLIYASYALRKSANHGEPLELLNALASQYEELLFAYTFYDDVIHRAMESGEHRYPWMDTGAMQRQKLGVYKIIKAQQEAKGRE